MSWGDPELGVAIAIKRIPLSDSVGKTIKHIVNYRDSSIVIVFTDDSFSNLDGDEWISDDDVELTWAYEEHKSGIERLASIGVISKEELSRVKAVELARIRAKQQDKEQSERREYERLKAKFGSDGL